MSIPTVQTFLQTLHTLQYTQKHNAHTRTYIPFLLIKQQIMMIMRSENKIITPMTAPTIM